MGYPIDSKIDQNNTAMFQSVHKKAGPAGLVSFLSLILALMCTGGVIVLGSVSLQQLLESGISDAVVGVLLCLTFGALFFILSFLCSIIGSVEGSGWAAATLTMILLPAIIGLFWIMSISGTALLGTLFGA